MFFASGNAGPVHPKAMRALVATNEGYMPSCGADGITAAILTAVSGTRWRAWRGWRRARTPASSLLRDPRASPGPTEGRRTPGLRSVGQ